MRRHLLAFSIVSTATLKTSMTLLSYSCRRNHRHSPHPLPLSWWWVTWLCAPHLRLVVHLLLPLLRRCRRSWQWRRSVLWRLCLPSQPWRRWLPDRRCLLFQREALVLLCLHSQPFARCLPWLLGPRCRPFLPCALWPLRSQCLQLLARLLCHLRVHRSWRGGRLSPLGTVWTTVESYHFSLSVAEACLHLTEGRRPRVLTLPAPSALSA